MNCYCLGIFFICIGYFGFCFLLITKSLLRIHILACTAIDACMLTHPSPVRLFCNCHVYYFTSVTVNNSVLCIVSLKPQNVDTLQECDNFLRHLIFPHFYGGILYCDNFFINVMRLFEGYNWTSKLLQYAVLDIKTNFFYV